MRETDPFARKMGAKLHGALSAKEGMCLSREGVGEAVLLQIISSLSCLYNGDNKASLLPSPIYSLHA